MPTILDQATLEQRSHRLRHVGRERIPIRFEADHRAKHVRLILAVECAPAREHLVQDAAERPDVATLVAPRVPSPVGRHVAAVPRITPTLVINGGVVIVGDAVDVGWSAVVSGSWLCEAEVQDFHRAVRREA